MKKIFLVILSVLVVLLSFSACSSKKSVEQKQEVSANATIEDEIKDSVTTSKIKITLRKYSFSVEDLWFDYSSFNKTTNKLSTTLNGMDLDVYVDNGKFKKCEISKKDDVGNHIFTITYLPSGEAESYVAYTYDEYGNISKSVTYDNAGKLSTIIKYQYDKKGNLVSEMQYNSSKSLEKVIEYENNDEGKHIKKYVYDKNKTLLSYSDYKYDGDACTENIYSAEGKLQGSVNHAERGGNSAYFKFLFSSCPNL